MLVTASHCHPSLLFQSKTGAYIVAPLKRLHGKAQTIGLVLKRFTLKTHQLKKTVLFVNDVFYFILLGQAEVLEKGLVCHAKF
jgi:hypothetical protein